MGHTSPGGHRVPRKVATVPDKCVPGEQEVLVHLPGPQEGNSSIDIPFSK